MQNIFVFFTMVRKWGKVLFYKMCYLNAIVGRRDHPR